MASKFSKRWTAGQLAALEKILADAARKANLGPMPESDFGLTDDGKVDFRGAVLREAVRYLRVSNVDFSDLVFQEGASINESELTDCRLDRIDMRNVFVRRRFARCSFLGAKLGGARLGGVFSDCTFEGARLSKAFATDVRFERCIFTGATLSGVHFISCTFDQCVFDGVKKLSGSVAGSRFIGESVQAHLSDCIVDNVRFAS